MHFKRFLIVSILLSFLLAEAAYGQDVVLKSNLLYWVTGTPNAAIEFATGKKHTWALEGGVQTWQYSDTKKLKHWLAQPEFRYWFCDAYNGHFIGIHALGGQFNAGGIKLPFGIFPTFKEHRYQGWAAGGGFTYGYQWLLGRRWNLELALGVGYLYIDYKKYACPGCGGPQKSRNRHYVGPTKAAVNLVYVLK